jgi:hypothetical protein
MSSLIYLNRWLFFYDQIGKTRAAMGRAASH